MAWRCWPALLALASALELEEPFEPPTDACGVRAILDDCNLIHLAAMDENRGVMHMRQINCTHWTNWVELGGLFAGGPTVVKNGRGQVEIYVRGVDKHLYRRVFFKTCASGARSPLTQPGETPQSLLWAQPSAGPFSYKPPKLHAGRTSVGNMRLYVRMIDQPPPAVTPSIGRAITLSIHGDDTIAATSQRISESLAEANAGVAAPVRIFHKGYELTDADLQRTVSQASILPESTLFVLPTAGDEAEALRKRVFAVMAQPRSAATGRLAGTSLYAPDDIMGSSGFGPVWECLGGCFTSAASAVTDTLGRMHIFVRGCDRAVWRLSQLAPAAQPDGRCDGLEGGCSRRAKVAAAALLQVEEQEQEQEPAGAGEGEGAGGDTPPHIDIVGNDRDAHGCIPSAGYQWCEALKRCAHATEECAAPPTLQPPEEEPLDDAGEGAAAAEVQGGEWTSMGGIGTSAPAAAIDAEGMIHVFSRGITRALTHTRQRWNGTAVAWEAWESLGGVLASGPQQRGISDGTNFLNLYVRGADKAVWRKSEQANVTTDPSGRRLGVRWSSWESLGGSMSSGVYAASTPDGLSEVFARGPDRGLWHKRQAFRAGSAEPSWGKWLPLSGTLSSAPEAVTVPQLQGEIHVFARGLDGGVWHKNQVGGALPNGSVAWTKWGSLGGHTRLFSC